MGGLFKGTRNETSGQTVSVPTLPPEFDQLNKYIATQALSEGKEGFTPYGGQRVAGLTADQTAAYEGIRGLSTVANPYIANASTALAGSGAPVAAKQWDMGQFNTYSNPFTQGVIDTTMSDILRKQSLDQIKLQGQAVNGGAFGGARYGIENQELGRNYTDAFARTAANLRQADYTQAQNMFTSDDQRRVATELGSNAQGMELAKNYQALGSNAIGLPLQAYAALEASGAGQQNQEQRGLDVAYQDFLANQGWDRESLSWLSSIAQGVPYGSYTGMNTYTQGTTPGASPLAQLSGLAAAVVGGYQAFKPRTGQG